MIHASSAATGKTTPPKRAAINPDGLTSSEPNGPNPVTKTRPDETVVIIEPLNENFHLVIASAQFVQKKKT
jgi:hypothetical protein